MSHSTEIENIKSAKKEHVCSWCATKIAQGESYKRCRWYDSQDASTVKMHHDCYGAALDLSEDGRFEFEFGEQFRGCNCFMDAQCKCQKKRHTKKG